MKPLSQLLTLALGAWLLAGPAAAQTPTAAPQPRTYVSGGQTLAYYEVGRGEPLVLLPGGPGAAGNCLFGLIDSLAGRYRLIIVDPRGCGRSRVPVVNAQTVSQDLDVADLEALRQHLKLDRLSLLGHSYGAQWAMAYAARYPARTGRLVLVDPSDTDNRFQEYFRFNLWARTSPELQRQAMALQQKMRQDTANIALQLEETKIAGHAYLFSQALYEPLVASITPETFNQAVGKARFTSAAFRTLNLAPALKSLRVPALIIHGRQDPLGEAVPLHVQSCLAGSQLVFINRCGHFPWLEQPREFYVALRPWLARPVLPATTAAK